MEIICERPYCELNLTASHYVIQEGIHFNDLSGRICYKFNTGNEKRGRTIYLLSIYLKKTTENQLHFYHQLILK